MRHSRGLLIGALGFAIVVALILQINFAGPSHSSGAIAADLSMPTATPKNPTPLSSAGTPATMYAPGVPAIQPSLAVVPGQPAFTAQDVIDYLATEPPSLWDPTSPPVTIENVEFVTARDLEARLGVDFGQPDDSLLCLVTVRGTFVHRVPPGLHAQGAPNPNAAMNLIFDANTGNFLAQGATN